MATPQIPRHRRLRESANRHDHPRVAPPNSAPVAVDDTATTTKTPASTSTSSLTTPTLTGERSARRRCRLDYVGTGAPPSCSRTAHHADSAPPPNANNNGRRLSFEYTVSDGTLDSPTGPVDVTVNPVDDNPVAVNDTATVDEDSGANTINVLANDTESTPVPRPSSRSPRAPMAGSSSPTSVPT